MAATCGGQYYNIFPHGIARGCNIWDFGRSNRLFEPDSVDSIYSNSCNPGQKFWDD